MSKSCLRRTLLACALAAAATSPEAWAGEREPQGRREASGLFDRLWAAVTALWDQAGCTIDPSGHCGALQAPAPTDTIDEGCTIDPNGACRTGS